MTNSPVTTQEKVIDPVLIPVHDTETFYDQAVYLHGEIRKNELIVATHSSSNTVLFRTPTSGLRALMATLSLSSNGKFSCLVDIAVTDKLKVKGRFVLKYLLLSPAFSSRINVETFATETSQIPSIAGAFFTNKAIFASAGWLEREVWDLFGIFSQDNPDLRRILTDYGFAGHPFRKDFPVTGFIELFYNDSEGRVVSEPVELAQELRIFHL